MKAVIQLSLFSLFLAVGFSCKLKEPIDFNVLKYYKTLNVPLKDIGTKINKTTDGNFIVCGISQDSQYMWAAKINIDGDPIWQSIYSELGLGQARDIIQTQDGNFMICGSVWKSTTNADIVVAKINNSDGKISKSYSFGGESLDLGLSIKQTADNGFIVAGFNSSTNNKIRNTTKQLGSGDMYLLKLKADGTAEWDSHFGGLNYEAAHTVIQLPDQSYMLCGSTTSKGKGGNDVYIVKTNIVGQLVRDTIYGDIGEDIAYSIKPTKDGYYILSGSTSSIKEGANGGTDVYILKIREDGSLLWKDAYGDVEEEVSYEIIETTDKGYAAIGFKENSNNIGFPQVYLVKTNIEGNETHRKVLNTQKYGRGASLLETRDCGLMIFGTSFSNNSKDFLIIKTDEDGEYE